MGLKSLQLIGNVKTLKCKTVQVFMYCAMNVYAKLKAKLHTFLTATLDEGER
jgi:hypothetical protein